MNKTIDAAHPRNLIAWMDGEVSPEDASAIAAHVEDCAECQTHLAVYREVGEYVEHACRTAVPPRVRWLPRVAAAFAMPVAAALALLFVDQRPVTAPPQQVYSGPAAGFVRISIPAEAVLPPGAAPEGVEFVADIAVNALP